MAKRLLVPFVALLTFTAALATNSVLRDDHPDRYVVVRGDTLWDISARFLRAPWLWPEIWQANPQVANPHLIYPGDVLNLAYLGDRPVINRQGPQVRESDEEAIPTIPLSAVEDFLKRMRVLSHDEFKHSPYIVATEENRLLASEANYVYARDLSAEPGQRVAIVRPTLVYRESSKFVRRLSKHVREVSGTPWDAADSIHAPDETRKEDSLLGYEVMDIAYAQVIRQGDPVTLLLDDTDREVKAGDLVLPIDENPFDLYFHPHQAEEIPEELEVMAVTDAFNAVGRYQVVALSRGAQDGLANGQVYSIFKPGERITDRVRYPKPNPFRDTTKEGARIDLPDDFAGHVMVFRVFDRVSYGLVMEGQRPVQLRDRLRAPYSLL